MREIRLRALAKINLALDVLGKREDGYHEVRMVMQTLNIFDKLNVRVTREPGIRIVTNLSYLPVNENNLVYKAARMMMEEFEILEGLSIDLYKYIPVAAGMAGGSSDAAAVIFAMNKLFRLGLTLDKMMDRGVKIGADVPYCLMRGTALAEGIGERLTRLPACPPCFVLVAKPPVNVSTKFVYGNLKADELTYHPDVDGFIEAMAAGDFYGMADLMGNVLETVTVPAYPVIDQLKQFMLEHGAIGAMMSGSGPTVFGLYTDLTAAKQTFYELKKSRMAAVVYLSDVYNVTY
ncbi:MAG: 4-(cytidine 5'-diphospho)-2-C-methyl-D-erythritol kinase [Lachnospiraceae bacterium]|nr:4-(cytidine 5'-diphospho)-2-C-methyl-D-erythritol kinase [Candidatus Fimimorpha excrementavium]